MLTTEFRADINSSGKDQIQYIHCWCTVVGHTQNKTCKSPARVFFLVCKS